MTVYIDGIFEYQRIVQGNTTRENNSLYVMDNQSRIALVRVGEPFPDDATPAVKYHLSDHLGSSNLAIDSSGAWVNREEYTPYGETSFGSFARKRYRYTGKERDEESGLYYHGARYYAPWLVRWATCDPLGTGIQTKALQPSWTLSALFGITGHQDDNLSSSIQSNVSLYEAFLLNPITYVDPDGRDPKDPDSEPPQRERGKGGFKRGQGEEQRKGLEERQEFQKKHRPSIKGDPKKGDPNENDEWEGERKRPENTPIRSGKRTADRDRKERDDKYKGKDPQQASSPDKNTPNARANDPYRQPSPPPKEESYFPWPGHPDFPPPKPVPPPPPPTPDPQPTPPPAPAPPPTPPPPDAEPGKPSFPEPTPRPVQFTTEEKALIVLVVGILALAPGWGKAAAAVPAAILLWPKRSGPGA